MAVSVLLSYGVAQCDKVYRMTQRGESSAIAVAAAPFTSEVWSLGSTVVDGGGYMLRKWTDGKWKPYDKGGMSLSVDPNGMPLLIDVKGSVTVLDKEGKWTAVSSGCTTQVIFGGKYQSAFKLGCSKDKSRGHAIYKADFKNREWKRFTKAGATSIAIDSADKLYAVNNGNLFCITNPTGKWQSI